MYIGHIEKGILKLEGVVKGCGQHTNNYHECFNCHSNTTLLASGPAESNDDTGKTDPTSP